MCRTLQIAAFPWLLSALLHGTSLVLLGLCQSATPGVGLVANRGTITVEVGWGVAVEPAAVVRLTSFHELPPLAGTAPGLLTPPEAAPGHEPQSAAAAPSPAPASPSLSPAGAIGETQLFGVRGRGQRFVYVFDRSSSMEGAPLAAAKRELLASLAALNGANQFQVIFYNQQPLPMPSARGGVTAMAAASDFGKRQAAAFLGGILADGSTDHWSALQLALALRPDVIYFLTDASDPQLSPAQLQAIRQANRQTTIHAIEFGTLPFAQPGNFLERLAMENGGQHTYIDVQLLPGSVR